MNTNYEWVDVYKKIADALLDYKKRQPELLSFIYGMFKETGSNNYLQLKHDGISKNFDKIDPFTVMGIFNRNNKIEKRIIIINKFIKFMKIDVNAPISFEGIPVLDARMSWFFGGKEYDRDTHIDKLWELFEIGIKLDDSPSLEGKIHFSELFDFVISQPCSKMMTTFGLFWIRATKYIPLDGNTQKYLNNDMKMEYDFKDIPSGNQYLEICEEVKNKIREDGTNNSFPALSFNAWSNAKGKIKPKVNNDEKEQINEDNGYIAEIKNALKELGGCGKWRDICVIIEKRDLLPNIKTTKTWDQSVSLYLQSHSSDSKNFNGKTDLFSWEKQTGIWRLRELNKKNIKKMHPVNQILYGPPGTGKTYNTAIYAVAICENKTIEEIKKEAENKGGYLEIKKRYETLIKANRIAFTTFHQSYGYEEFIEGIKPVLDDTVESVPEVKYEIKPGVFKRFCEEVPVTDNSATTSNSYNLKNGAKVWKVSLEGTGENPTRSDCLENSRIRIGWDLYGEKITDETKYDAGGKAILNAFINEMQIGDIVCSCYSSTLIDAIGEVTGEYEWIEEGFANYKRSRKVNWLIKGIKYDINGITGKVMTLSTIYKLKLTIADIIKILSELKGVNENVLGEKLKSVFIIDEINRGNISKIFGELITLVEDTKRLGESEELKAVLPYSERPFGIPNNVYILGTMNTADRSIALIDTALRRRFNFVEMMPDIEVLRGVKVIKEGVSIDVPEMLDTMNKRIEFLYDREHTLGHAFFTELLKEENRNIDNLANIFKNKIIPLLQEYFYDDYEKIRLVLGDNAKEKQFQFISEQEVGSDIFMGKGKGSEADLDNKKIFNINGEAFKKVKSYIGIYGKIENATDIKTEDAVVDKADDEYDSGME